jgi:hypothetical protein
LAAALAVVLAGGAVWSFAALMLRDDAPWLALPMALLAAWGSGQFGLTTRALRGFAAAVLTATGIAYAHWLIAANLVAAVLGIGFGHTLMDMGAEMTLALMRERAGPGALVLLAAAPLVAALLAASQRPLRTA